MNKPSRQERDLNDATTKLVTIGCSLLAVLAGLAAVGAVMTGGG
jgi:hypothetical protein